MATADSDAVEEMNCDNCKYNGEIKDAISFCFNCKEYFCVSCDKFHGKLQSNHKVSYGKDMPSDRATTSFMPCQNHSNESAEFYCERHLSVFCQLCKQLKHKSCATKDSQSAIKSVNVEKDVNATCKLLSELKSQTHKAGQEKQSELQQLAKRNHECINTSKTLRKQLNAFFDRHDAHIESQEKSSREKISSQVQSCVLFGEHVEAQVKSMEGLKEEANKEKMFLATIEAKTVHREYQNALTNVCRVPTSIEDFNYHDTVLPSLIKGLSSFCTLQHTSPENSFWDMKSFSLIKTVAVGTEDDSNLPSISGCCIVADDRIVLCDSPNCKIKLFDSELRHKSYVTFPSAPFDIVKIDEKSVAVTVPDATYIQIVSVLPGLRLEHKLQVDNKCYGITLHNNEIYVCVAGNKQGRHAIQILSMKGSLRASIHVSTYACPRYLSVNSDGTKLFHSGKDRASGIIVCTTRDSYVLFNFTGISSPQTIQVDADTNLLVCSGDNSVFVLRNDGTECKTLKPGKGDNTAIHYNRRSNTLIVTSILTGTRDAYSYEATCMLSLYKTVY